jgi:hypothetical protein
MVGGDRVAVMGGVITLWGVSTFKIPEGWCIIMGGGRKDFG